MRNVFIIMEITFRQLSLKMVPLENADGLGTTDGLGKYEI
jgi:hypothetical protein